VSLKSKIKPLLKEEAYPHLSEEKSSERIGTLSLKGQVAGFHRALPSTSLDKSVLLNFLLSTISHFTRYVKYFCKNKESALKSAL